MLLLPMAYLSTRRDSSPRNEPSQVAMAYLKAVYARDYRTAYQWISAQDRRYKSETDYLRENPPFSDGASELAYKLANEIEWRQIQREVYADKAAVRFTHQLGCAQRC